MCEKELFHHFYYRNRNVLLTCLPPWFRCWSGPGADGQWTAALCPPPEHSAGVNVSWWVIRCLGRTLWFLPAAQHEWGPFMSPCSGRAECCSEAEAGGLARAPSSHAGQSKLKWFDMWALYDLNQGRLMDMFWLFTNLWPFHTVSVGRATFWYLLWGDECTKNLSFDIYVSRSYMQPAIVKGVAKFKHNHY